MLFESLRGEATRPRLLGSAGTEKPKTWGARAPSGNPAQSCCRAAARAQARSGLISPDVSYMHERIFAWSAGIGGSSFVYKPVKTRQEIYRLDSLMPYWRLYLFAAGMRNFPRGPKANCELVEPFLSAPFLLYVDVDSDLTPLSDQHIGCEKRNCRGWVADKRSLNKTFQTPDKGHYKEHSDYESKVKPFWKPG